MSRNLKCLHQPTIASPDYDHIFWSIDYDGSAGPHEHEAGSLLYVENQMLKIAELLRAHPNAKLKLFNGSFRNTRDINEYCKNLNKNGCVFEFLIKVEAELKTRWQGEFKDRVELIKLLMEDIALDKPLGTCFANPKPFSPRNCISWHGDNKHAILYVQRHFAQLTYPGNNLFVFCDDVKEILDSLFKLFSITHPDWNPLNQQCRLLPYQNGQWGIQYYPALNYKPLTGAGLVDSRYAETVKVLDNPLKAELIRNNVSDVTELLSIPAYHHFVLLEIVKSSDWGAAVATVMAEQAGIRENLLGCLAHIAIAQNAFCHIRRILEYGLNPLFRHKDQTVLEAACNRGQWDVVELLAKLAADQNDPVYGVMLLKAVKDEKIEIAISLAKKIQPSQRLYCEYDLSALFYAVINKHYDLIDAILEGQNPSDPLFSNAYKQSFRSAVSNNNAEIIKRLAPFTQNAAKDLRDIFQDATPPAALCFIENTHGFSPKQKTFLIQLTEKIIHVQKNKTVLTKSFIREILAITNDQHDAIFAACPLDLFYTQTAGLEGDAYTKECLIALSVLIIINAPLEEMEPIVFIKTKLLFDTLITTDNMKKLFSELQNKITPTLEDTTIARWKNPILQLNGYFHIYLTILYGQSRAGDEAAVDFILSALPSSKPSAVNREFIISLLCSEDKNLTVPKQCDAGHRKGCSPIFAPPPSHQNLLSELGGLAPRIT